MGPSTLALVLAVAALAAAGCGDDEGTGAGGTAATPQPTATATSTPAQPAAEQRDCGEVAYAPQTDHGAFEITATGTTCDTARAIATAAEDASGSFSAEGFQCSGRRQEGALPSTRWTCESGDARVRFVTS